MLFVPSGGSAILALRTQWLGSVSFARSPTGRSFQMTVEVDGGRVDSETAGSAAAMDSAYTFMEMDVADENTVNECVSRVPPACLRVPVRHWPALLRASVGMSRPALSARAARRRPQEERTDLRRAAQLVRLTTTTATRAATTVMTMMTSRTTKTL